MDLREYFGELRKTETRLIDKFPNRVVFVTSVKNSSKNSTAGATYSTTPYNAARGLTDETHRESTTDEIEAFMAHQENNRVETQRSEAKKRKEIVVVMDRQQVHEEFPEGSRDLVESAMAASSSKRKSAEGV